jgi:hypothetical protein
MYKVKSGLKRAYDQIPKGLASQLREELKEAIGVKTDVNLYTYIRGDVEPKLSQALAIEKVFQKYGISVNWEN